MSRQLILLSVPLVVSAAVAQEPAELGAIVVSATRFEQSNARLPSNMSVISAKEIQSSTAGNLPDLLKNYAGVGVSSLYGNIGIDAAVDLRGFGPGTGFLNTLVLLDGQRLNPISMDAINWSLVPLNNIERIEIMRGSGTVLYGDGATGGVINIITKKSGRPEQSVTLGLGSNETRVADAHLSTGGEQGYLNLSGHYTDTEGWRENSAATQKSIAGRAGIDRERVSGFVDFAGFNEDTRLPGALSESDFRNRPRLSKTPTDFQKRDGYRVRPGGEVRISDALTFSGEVSYDTDNYHTYSGIYQSIYDRSKEHVSVTPRLSWLHGLPGTKSSQTVVGLDYYEGNWNSQSVSPIGLYRARAEQQSHGWYLQNVTAIDQAWTLVVGGRSQEVRQEAFDNRINGTATRSRQAGEMGLSYLSGAWKLYGKAGTTFRFANTDELFGYDIFRNRSIFAGNLRPQHGTTSELGANARFGSFGFRLAVYELKLKDEILYDSNLFTNINTDPTRRQGGELESDWAVNGQVKLRAAYTYQEAEFRRGAFAGKRIPMVPVHKGTLTAQYSPSEQTQYAATLNYVGERHMSGDYTNTLKSLPDYTTLDLLASWRLAGWTVAAKVLNALDKRYANWATYQMGNATYGYAMDYYYYPGEGRSFLLSARYDFK